eukprot:3939817-Pyramimonas_sp.AAC.1
MPSKDIKNMSREELVRKATSLQKSKDRFKSQVHALKAENKDLEQLVERMMKPVLRALHSKDAPNVVKVKRHALWAPPGMIVKPDAPSDAPAGDGSSSD